ncbi:MAG: hypothetical protein ACR2PL_16895 [Dehalococcoidia bacterium]
MQLLVIGIPLPNPRIDNYSFFSAPSFFDYDAILVEPDAVSQVIEEIVSGGTAQNTGAQEPIVNAPTAGLNVGLADQLRRRRDEAERLLQRGGTIAVFARPARVHPHIAGFSHADSYSWLPNPASISYAEPFLVPAFGTKVIPTDSSSPLASFVEGYQQWFHYRAYFSERIPNFSSSAHVFARSVGGAAVGVEFRYGSGRIIFLPAMYQVPAGDPRFTLASTLLEGLRQSVHAAQEDEAPAWAGTIPLPGVEPLEAAAERATRQLTEAQEQFTEAQANLRQLTRYRRLLWQEGRYGLEPVVRDAFQALGFYVTLDLDRPLVLEADGHTAFVEVEGSQETVVEWPYFRLQKRLEKDLLETRQPKKGVIVVNGQRSMAPAERSAPYSDTLRVAAENYRYALLTAEQLLSLVREALEHPEPDSLRRLRDLIFAMTGTDLPPGFPTTA